jgi:hypothetical protein
VFVNIQNQSLIFTGKFNHLIITKCKNLKVSLKKAISGIDVMQSKEIEVNVDEFDYISFFGCANSAVNSKMKIDETEELQPGIIHLSCCLDIYYNKQQLRCNPYINIAHRNGAYEIVPSSHLNNLKLSINYTD